MLKFYAVQCPKCGDQVYSVCRRDYRACSCMSVYIDGDSQIPNLFSYFRVGSQNLDEHTPVGTIIEVDATKKELYADWNQLKHPRKYGLIKTTETNDDKNNKTDY